METLESFTMESLGSKEIVDVERLTLGTVRVNQFEFLVMRGVAALDRASDSTIAIAPSELDEIDCISYVEWQCENIACSRTCKDTGGDCNCPGYGFCSSWLHVSGMSVNCDLKCELYNPIGYLAWCDCE